VQSEADEVGRIVLTAEGDLSTRLSDGTVVHFQRHCPHRGHDLLGASVVDDRLTCPLHKWCFSLRDGALLTRIPEAMYTVKPRLQCRSV
jgi:nitrite reductase/ring-hydroxylating ferredoxin subunit